MWKSTKSCISGQFLVPWDLNDDVNDVRVNALDRFVLVVCTCKAQIIDVWNSTTTNDRNCRGDFIEMININRPIPLQLRDAWHHRQVTQPSWAWYMYHFDGDDHEFPVCYCSKQPILWPFFGYCRLHKDFQMVLQRGPACRSLYGNAVKSHRKQWGTHMATSVDISTILFALHDSQNLQMEGDNRSTPKCCGKGSLWKLSL